ncbi:MAG: bifunctional 5,10-methylenetetrahydrofolate dehydrogenase/5,10-methenyltetrahydrofolate cyclohydrolase [Candidatus Omnitrophica bacterium]|nr:bifunctional 5,10-methylenetetrahydrofolate dehydrogenase/5,10-methenyltetrahydrofolate cyclohydrolase [Candidatus Omnitrophota bacterium]MDD3987425.1 bifunctional 5,10-methylenetetrahydrofolate dehydrogenase/5,10-methenyltetrahydrofolate cyclohydrolase [Candidatus Omnitrophota bacterium]MDD4981298.1 bifunctional 5,10-methylenetetrahydrofolate dehydrogenase/5,10-methenyltetrahydrofolate cyclohydrolase [Candidatus Omnitrophota bacterium]MDD5664585.1 bifunctional 5,10-methylenetetrahydrofolate 
MAILLEGRHIAEKVKEDIRLKVLSLKIRPSLASLMVGDNSGAVSYVKSQAKAAEELGVEYQIHKLSSSSSQEDIIGFVRKLNNDKSVNGIIIQNPLPEKIDYKAVSFSMDPEKDIEGVHPANIAGIITGRAKFIPCTAYAVMELISASGINLYGKEAVIVGHSSIVGKPLVFLLLDKLATVTICHIGTSQAGKLEDHIRRAEVLVVAVGKANLIKGEWIKEGAVVIDVGINRVNGKIVGDVEFSAAEKKAAFITPVPGGVGPLTVAMLMRNLVEAARLQQG